MKRIPVSMTNEERNAIEAGMRSEGFRSLSDYLRFCAMKAAAKILEDGK
jgi:hypothetical protein